MPVTQVEVYTDGSRKVNTNGTSAAWAAILHDDAYEKGYMKGMGGSREQTT
jgi:ribonuclease HI